MNRVSQDEFQEMTQPKALRIADDLDSRKVEPQAASALRILHSYGKEGWRYADELEQERKRLHEENERLRQELEQPDQKPVAWVECAVIPWLQSKDTNVYAMTKLHRAPNEYYDTPLYTAPPKREWIDLTEEEAFACRGLDFFDTYKNINDKLKEKNT